MVVAPGRAEPSDGSAGVDMMERVSAVAPFGGDGAPGEAEALDALEDVIVDHGAS